MFNKFNFWALFALLFVVGACVDQDFDTPPAEAENFEIPENIVSIASLKAKHVEGEFERLEADEAIRGIVIADDESGNYFKTLVIQDETGGIEVKINATGLYNDYPIGREIYVKLQGLYMGDFAGLTQIGGVLYFEADGDQRLGGIEDIFIEDFIIKGKRDQFLTPTKTTITSLGNGDVSTLIELENVQIFGEDIGTPFADAVNKFSFNLTVEDCNNEVIVLRSSGYSSFADELTPEGNGSLTGVYSVFGETKQIIIRDLDDVMLTGNRCDGSSGGGGGEDNTETIRVEDLKTTFASGSTSAPSNSSIQAIVISDREAENITNRNLVVQDGNRGIVIRFTDTHNYNMGDEIRVNVSGLELSEFNGLLQVNNVPSSRVTRVSDGNEVTPTVLSIADLLADFENYESTLVTFEGVTLSNDNQNTYGGGLTMNDGTGDIVLFTTFYSAFANTPYPTNEITLTGIVGQGTEEQIEQVSVRNLDDVEGGNGGTGGGGGGSSDPFDVTFDSGQINFEPASIEGWQNVNMKGNGTWRAREFDGNWFVEARGFQDPDPEVEAWFISPEIDFDTYSTVSFQSSIAFWTHGGLSVLISTDYDGSNIESATWEELDAADLAGQNNENYAWVESGVVNFGKTGKGHIAFRHIGDNSNNTESSRLDNIVIE